MNLSQSQLRALGAVTRRTAPGPNDIDRALRRTLLQPIKLLANLLCEFRRLAAREDVFHLLKVSLAGAGDADRHISWWRGAVVELGRRLEQAGHIGLRRSILLLIRRETTGASHKDCGGEGDEHDCAPVTAGS